MFYQIPRLILELSGNHKHFLFQPQSRLHQSLFGFSSSSCLAPHCLILLIQSLHHQGFEAKTHPRGRKGIHGVKKKIKVNLCRNSHLFLFKISLHWPSSTKSIQALLTLIDQYRALHLDYDKLKHHMIHNIQDTCHTLIL